MNKKILLSGCLTGGHVFPILSLGSYLSRYYEVLYLGVKNQFEEKVFPKNSIFLNVNKSLKKNLLSKSFYQEIKKYQKELSAYDIFISAGGLSTFLITRFSKNKPLFLLEQNVVLGDANKFFYLKAKKIFLAYEITKCKGNKFVLAGNPSLTRFNQEKVKYKNKIIFMFGSLSSATLEIKTLKYFFSNLFLKNYEYVFVTKKTNLKLKDNIKIVSFLNVEEYLDSSNLFFVRAGGSTSYEFIYSNMNCVFIPSPYVKHNHQEKNAKYFLKKYNYPYVLEKDYNSYTICNYILKLKKNIHNINQLNTLKIIKDVIDEYLS